MLSVTVDYRERRASEATKTVGGVFYKGVCNTPLPITTLLSFLRENDKKTCVNTYDLQSRVGWANGSIVNPTLPHVRKKSVILSAVSRQQTATYTQYQK